MGKKNNAFASKNSHFPKITITHPPLLPLPFLGHKNSFRKELIIMLNVIKTPNFAEGGLGAMKNGLGHPKGFALLGKICKKSNIRLDSIGKT